ncbi:MAG: hypothetical protein RLY16_1912 [Bacteroidota bacterium]
MVFNSLHFLFFFTGVITLYYIVPATFRWVVLLLASTLFYWFSSPSMVLIPLLITLVTYYGGKAIAAVQAQEKKAQQIFIATLLVNIGLLVFFKYFNFFGNTVVDLLNWNRSSDQLIHNNLLLQIAAPLGISYITFQSIGYLLEIKRGNQPAEESIAYLATFLLYFPKVISGPVERAHQVIPQLKTPQTFNYDNLSAGLKLVVWGMFKKLVIADRLGIYIGSIFENTSHHSGLSILAACIFYVFQMYADFSGYTDMALGISRCFGIKLMDNFNRPFFAKSVTEFWRKWHISLSTWFADYFFTPIAINRRNWGNTAIVYASFVTFVTLGFWHGANWTFIVFGTLQGIILAIEFYTKKFRKNLRKKIPVSVNNAAGIAFTFFYFMISLTFFRAATVSEALGILKGIVTQKGSLFVADTTVFLFSILGIGFLVAVETKREYFSHWFQVSAHPNWLVRNAYFILLVLIILLAGVFDGGQFIYRQF